MSLWVELDVQGLDGLVVGDSAAISIDIVGVVECDGVLLSGVLLGEDEVELEVSIEDEAGESGAVVLHVEVLSRGDGQEGEDCDKRL